MCTTSIKAFKLITNIELNLAHIATIMLLKNNNTYNARLITITFFVANLYNSSRSQSLQYVRHKVVIRATNRSSSNCLLYANELFVQEFCILFHEHCEAL
jgi:hypothetical protein